MGAPLPRGLRPVLAGLNEASYLFPPPVGQLIRIVLKFLDESQKVYTQDGNSNDFKERLEHLEIQIQVMTERISSLHTPKNHDSDKAPHIETPQSYRAVFNILLNDLAIDSLTLRADSLLNALKHDSVPIGRACFLGRTGDDQKLSCIFNEEWPQKYHDAKVLTKPEDIQLTFPNLHGFLTSNGNETRVNGAFTVPLQTKAHFELSIPYGSNTAIKGELEPLREIVLSEPVEVKVPGMRATKVEIFARLQNTKGGERRFILIVPAYN